MSMLIRTGTLVRKNTRKSSVRRTRSAGSTASASHSRPPDDGDYYSSSSSVPTSPVAKLHHQHGGYTQHSLTNSPAKASLGTNCSTVVSFDDNRFAYRTSVDRSLSADPGQHHTSLQIEEANKEAENVCDFLCTSYTIICSSTFITSAVGLSVIVPIMMIALGIKYLNECPLQPRIPIFHMVGGGFGVVKIALTLWRSIRQRHQESTDNLNEPSGIGGLSRTYRTMNICLSLFLLVWHILGTIWTLGIWKPRFKPLLHSPNLWCDRSLYFFSVAVIVGVYAVLALGLLGVTCLVCVYRSQHATGLLLRLMAGNSPLTAVQQIWTAVKIYFNYPFQETHIVSNNNFRDKQQQ